MFNDRFNEPDPNGSQSAEQNYAQPLYNPPAPYPAEPRQGLAGRNERLFFVGMFALALAVGIVIGTFITRPAAADHQIRLVSSKGAFNDPSTFANVVQTIRPSVVHITSVEENARGLGGIFGGGGGRRTGTGSGG